MNASETKQANGRWVYTTACPRFEGDTAKVRAYDGSIHAGWENSPEFSSPDEFYTWAKAECSRRNTLEQAAPDLLEALKHCLGWIDAWDPTFTQDDAWPEYRAAFNAAISKAEGRAQ